MLGEYEAARSVVEWVCWGAGERAGGHVVVHGRWEGGVRQARLGVRDLVAYSMQPKVCFKLDS